MHAVDDDTPVEAALARAIEQQRARRGALYVLGVVSLAVIAWFVRRSSQD